MTVSHTSNIAEPAVHTGASEPLERVGAVLQQLSAGRVVSDRELRQHAHDCGHLMEDAYASFQASGDPSARDEAVLWLDRRNHALLQLQARGTLLNSAEHDGAFFASDEAQAMGRRAA